MVQMESLHARRQVRTLEWLSVWSSGMRVTTRTRSRWTCTCTVYIAKWILLHYKSVAQTSKLPSPQSYISSSPVITY
jgi:hypothetical protein